MVIHFNVDGNIIKENSDEHSDQVEYWNMKKDKDQKLLLRVNEGI